MANTIQAIRGMNDILPMQTAYWSYLEGVLRQVADCYGYDEIRFPVLEPTSLFRRTIGPVTDIIEKEMYTFLDRNGESISMRPEGTAGCVRAGIQHGLFYNQAPRLWYLGSMFRYERPQQGRFRQFFQFGVEAFGMPGPDIDAEQILMAKRIWDLLGLKDQITLQINSLGNTVSREKYRIKLVEYFNENIEILDEDSKRRLTTNPLRILDSKNENMQLMLSAAPRMIDFLDADSHLHFEKFIHFLNDAHIPYEINSRIVRGLDYYNGIVYEWVTERLGAQGTICAGGRYDNLVEHLGGKATPAVGFAMGLERVVALLESVYTPNANPQIYLLTMGDKAVEFGMRLAEKIHTYFPEIKLINDFLSSGFKAKFKRADKSGAKIALIIGEEEVDTESISLKYLREAHPQIKLDESQLFEALIKILGE